MKEKDLQSRCLKKKILLDKTLSKIFSSFEDSLIVDLLLEKIKALSGKKFLNFSLIKKNKEEIISFLEKNPSIKEEERKKIYSSFGFLEERIKKKKNPFNRENSEVKILSSSLCLGRKIEVKDFVTYFRKRYEDLKNFLQEKKGLENLVSINKIPKEKQKFSIIGMVYNKKITKNKNLLLEVEDLGGKIKVLINSNKEALLKEGEDILLDAVLGFKGTGNSEILFANEVFFPETFLSEKKKGNLEEYAIFIGDIHYGSKNFLEEDFLKFIDYLNGGLPNTPESSKIKYLFIVGDLVTGIGNYPDQEKDLLVKDLEEQFEGIAKILSKIRKDIKIIISPGNHDGVRLMEPQPFLNEKYAWPLYDLENVIFTENPSLINIGKRDNFEGFKVLLYHGFSFPYYANNVPKLMLKKAMNQPEKIMEFLLKNRHLAPTHASTQYFPLEKDPLLIREVPDIFVSGHTHKSGVMRYNNILVLSSSSWEGKTPYQEKFGNEPDHCKAILFNLKSQAVKILDFETKKKNE